MSGKKYTILLIEDEEMLSDMYEIKFVKEGYQVKKALDVESGFKMATQGVKPDLILLDIIMPKLVGFSV